MDRQLSEDEVAVLRLIARGAETVEEYERIMPGLGQTIADMVRAELAHQRRMGAQDPVAASANALREDFCVVTEDMVASLGGEGR